MLPVFGMITPTVAVIVLIIALIIFGPGKLPDLGKSLGRGIKEFKDATEGVEEVKTAVKAPVKAVAPVEERERTAEVKDA